MARGKAAECEVLDPNAGVEKFRLVTGDQQTISGWTGKGLTRFGQIIAGYLQSDLTCLPAECGQTLTMDGKAERIESAAPGKPLVYLGQRRLQ
jgi:hypothetical protein